jgi:hypothetical protein
MGERYKEPPQAASRRGGFLRMRNAVNAIEDLPHAEEHPWVRLEACDATRGGSSAAVTTILNGSNTR